jgi:hypothetical protein
MVKVDWLNDLEWDRYIDDVRDLQENHATIARAGKYQPDISSNTKTSRNVDVCKRQFSVLFERLATEIKNKAVFDQDRTGLF